MLQIAVINESSVIQNTEVGKMIPAFQTQWNSDLKPIWGLESAAFVSVPANQKPPSGSWWVVFLDDSDQAGALAYHDLTNEGLPISKVFCKTILADNALISVGATHEICEMACDPWLNGAYQDAQGVFWAAEVCDPVEADEYGYDIGGVTVSNFVTPSWYAHQYSQGPIDFKGHAQSAFEVLSGGYAQRFDQQSGWVQVTGSRAASLSHAAAKAPVGCRRERRLRHWRKWERSNPRW